MKQERYIVIDDEDVSEILDSQEEVMHYVAELVNDGADAEDISVYLIGAEFSIETDIKVNLVKSE